MLDPTTSTITAWAAAFSGITLALFGVDYYSLLYGLVGAMLAMHQAEAMTRLRAVVYVVLSTLVGAALGSGALALFGVSSKPLLIVCSIVGGAGAHVIVSRLLKVALTRIDSMGEGGKQP